MSIEADPTPADIAQSDETIDAYVAEIIANDDEATAEYLSTTP